MESYDYNPRQPVAEQTKKPSVNVLIYLSLAMNLAVVALLAFMLTRAPSPPPGPGPGPGPGPNVVIPEDVVSMMVDAERNLAIYEAEISEQLGQAVADGSITTSEQFAKQAIAATQKAEDEAFEALNALNNKYITDDPWNKDAIVEFQRLKAQGKRKVGK